MAEMLDTMRRLRETLTQHLSEEDIKTLCFDLDIDYENIPGDGKITKVRELLSQLRRIDGIIPLINAITHMKAGEQWIDYVKESAGIFYQEKPYESYIEAFLDAGRYISTHLEWGTKNGVPNPKVDIKVIAVAMTFSWPFIIDKIPTELTKYPNAIINLEVLFVDHHYLSTLPLADYDINWAMVSEHLSKDVQRFARSATKKFGDRLIFSAKAYKNLPHWHGMLVNEEHLFLGRTNWTFPDGKPELRVGQNKYRYFNTSSTRGSDRIELFKNWHKYYFDFNSALICSTPVLNPEQPLSE